MRIYIILSLSLVLMSQSNAHQMKEALSVMNFNTKTSQLEVAHRIYMHDAELAVKKLFDKSADIIKKQETQKLFANYIESHFSLSTDKKLSIELNLLGYEIKGRYFWVYQEVPISNIPKSLNVKFDALMDLWSSQRNVINIEGVKDLISLELYLSKTEMTVEF